MKKLVIVLVVIMVGMIGLNISISAHKAEVKAAKEAVFCSNTRQYVEWYINERARRHARALAYIYWGEENAPEIAAAEDAMNVSKAAWAAYNVGDITYDEARAASHAAVWEAGKNLCAWAERTGRAPMNWGEGIMYCYLADNADGSEREETLKLSNTEKISAFERKVWDMFKF